MTQRYYQLTNYSFTIIIAILFSHKFKLKKAMTIYKRDKILTKKLNLKTQILSELSFKNKFFI